ncbi:MAG: hypothetical protein R2939_15710 [Kofleriaceae bacterium]
MIAALVGAAIVSAPALGWAEVPAPATAPATATPTPAGPTPAPAPKPGPTPQPAPPPKPAPDGSKPGPITDDDLAKAQREDVRPWAKDVTPEQQRQALVLFTEANDLLRDALFVRAVEKYREALRYWRHPAIYYNLALALVNLDQPVEMDAALDEAMRYGEAPLDADKLDRAKGYKLLVAKQIATVEYSVDVAGAKVTFDGTEVLVGPGTWEARVRAGDHAVAASAEGYLPVQFTQKLGGGETTRLRLRLYTDAEVTRYRRRFATWLPWTVTGVGVAIAGVGALLHASALSGFDAYDAAIAECARTDPSGGCSSPSPDITDRRRTAESRQLLGISGYALGGAAIAAGVTMLVLNRPSSYRINPGAEAVPAPAPVAVTPVIGDGVLGLAASGRF